MAPVPNGVRRPDRRRRLRAVEHIPRLQRHRWVHPDHRAKDQVLGAWSHSPARPGRSRHAPVNSRRPPDRPGPNRTNGDGPDRRSCRSGAVRAACGGSRIRTSVAFATDLRFVAIRSRHVRQMRWPHIPPLQEGTILDAHGGDGRSKWYQSWWRWPAQLRQAWLVRWRLTSGTRFGIGSPGCLDAAMVASSRSRGRS
jgi:hypothetical protein